MPRRPGIGRRKMWAPLELSHDFAAREHDIYQERIPTNNPGEADEGLVIFVETIDSMSHPRPIFEYISDNFSQSAAIIFYHRDTERVNTSTGQAYVAACSFRDVPHDATGNVMGSSIKLPLGPIQGQRMLILKHSINVFSIAVWCSTHGNWSLVAAYRTDGSTVTMAIKPAEWNESTLLLLASHLSQFTGLRRLYKLGTGVAVHPDNVVVERIHLDPFTHASQMHKHSSAQTGISSGNISEQAFTQELDQDNSTTLSRTTSSSQPVQLPQYQHMHAALLNGMQQYAVSGYIQDGMPQYCGALPHTWTPYLTSQATGGAVQMPEISQMYHPHQLYNAAYTQPYGYQPAPVIETPPHSVVNESPTITRTALRNTVMTIPSQAQERNKNIKYRTVLYDPFRDNHESAMSSNDVTQTAQQESTAAVQEHQQTQYNKASTVMQHQQQQLIQEVSKPPKHHPVLSPHLMYHTTPKASSQPEHETTPKAESPLTARRQEQPFEYLSLSLEGTVIDRTYHTPKQPVVIMAPRGMEASLQNFNGPFFTGDMISPPHTSQRQTTGKTHDQSIHDWWLSGNKFARQEEFHQSLLGASDGNTAAAESKPYSFDLSRLLVPVVENLECYIEGPKSKCRDYWCQWQKAPEWCVDTSAEGSKSFFDKDWGCPPARIGRDPRYQAVPREQVWTRRHGNSGARSEDRYGRLARG